VCRFVAKEVFECAGGHAKARPTDDVIYCVCQINAPVGRRTHGPCVPTSVVCRIVARVVFECAGGHGMARVVIVGRYFWWIYLICLIILSKFVTNE
jgi:hypothetical protein